MLYYWIVRRGAGNWGGIWSNLNGCSGVTVLPLTYDDVPVRVNEDCWLGFAWANSSDEEIAITGHSMLELVSPSGLHYSLEPLLPEDQDVTVDPCWLPGGDYTGGKLVNFGMWKFTEPGTWTAKMHLTETDTGEILDEPETLFMIVGEPGALPPSYYRLLGDVNFDGIVNSEDIEMVRAQVGNDWTKDWGIGSSCYNPNADFDADGWITSYDLKVVKSRFGASSPWHCVTKNPSLIDGGVDWYPQNSFEAGVFPQQHREHTEFSVNNKRGFDHYLFCLPVVGFPAWTWTEAGIGEPYEHPDSLNPQPWKGDLPLKPCINHEFHIKSFIGQWSLGDRGYLEAGFGLWVILDKPYTIICSEVPEYGEIPFKSRIIEVMIAVRNEYSGENITPGGDNWHRVFWRIGWNFNPKKGLVIFQHFLDKQPVGETVTHCLAPEVFEKLMWRLENEQPFVERNPIPPIGHALQQFFVCPKFRMEDVDLTGAKLRLAYFNLEGATDYFATQSVEGRFTTFGIYHYYKKHGVFWKPTLSDSVQVIVS